MAKNGIGSLRGADGENSRERLVGRVQVICAALLMGTAGICVSSVCWSPMSQIASRNVIALILLMLFMRGPRIRITRTRALGAVMMSATGMLYISAIKLTGAGTAIVLQYIAPILVFLYSVIFDKRKAQAPEVAITAIVFGGIVLCFADKMDMRHLLGNILGILSGFTFAGQILVMNHEKTPDGNRSTLILSCVLSMIVSLPFMITDRMLVWDFKNIFWICILGVFEYALANILLSKGIRRVDAVEGSLMMVLEPVVNPILVAVFLGERMGPAAIAGAVIVIAGVTVYSLLDRLSGKRTGEAERSRI